MIAIRKANKRRTIFQQGNISAKKEKRRTRPIHRRMIISKSQIFNREIFNKKTRWKTMFQRVKQTRKKAIY